ncbi:CAT RNA binding domain-containing protein, partial [Weizmannia sp. CD-2023]
MEAFIVTKVLNNNLSVASHPRSGETVLIGQWLGVSG